jgi:hypothetical protein
MKLMGGARRTLAGVGSAVATEEAMGWFAANPQRVPVSSQFYDSASVELLAIKLFEDDGHKGWAKATHETRQKWRRIAAGQEDLPG